MSPLIDVTNSGVIVNEQQSKKPASKKGNCRLQRKRSALVDRVGLPTENSTTEESLVQTNSVSCYTNMCNTCVNNGNGKKTSQRKLQKGEDAIDNMRVPPLPQASADVLSQAVEALSLGPLTVPSKSSSVHRFHRQRKLNCKQIAKSSNGHPENSDGASAARTPQQCGACGLEFTSLPVLTQHLAKHVYDGIYAAQWLTQAMALVTPRQPSEDALSASSHSVPRDSACVALQSTEQCPSSSSGSNP